MSYWAYSKIQCKGVNPMVKIHTSVGRSEERIHVRTRMLILILKTERL